MRALVFAGRSRAVIGAAAAGAAAGAATFFRAGGGAASAFRRGGAGCLAGTRPARGAFFTAGRVEVFFAGAFRAAAFLGFVLAAAFFGAAWPDFLGGAFFAAVRPRSVALRAPALPAAFLAGFFAVLAGAFREVFFAAVFRAARLREAAALAPEVFEAVLGRAVFFLPEADLDVFADLVGRADFAAVRGALVTDLDCFRGSAFPPLRLLAFFAFGLALPAMVTSWA